MDLVQNLAIQADNVFVSVKQSWRQLTILNGLSLTVPKGCVYGLIGPSGCGKTTFQRCLLGQHILTSGLVRVMGHPLTGQSESDFKTNKLLGPMIGYMPQDVALDNELTVDEMVTFFGRLYGLTEYEIDHQLEKLSHLLDLSFDRRKQKINSLSLGTCRRVSLICSLLHSPQLLLLDEPTVGSDPIAVEKIWNHLLYLRSQNGMTIVLATHYLEEVNKADYFAFMSQGKVIIEDTPEQFKKRQNSCSLESAILSYYISKKFLDHSNLRQLEKSERKISLSASSPMKITKGRLNHLEAFKLLTWRYWSRWKAFTLYQFLGLGGLLVCVLFTMGILFGHYPKGLTIGVINYDDDGMLSKRYIESLKFQSNDWLIKIYSDESDARFHLEKGKLSGYLVIGEHFDETLAAFSSSSGGLHFGNDNQATRSQGIIIVCDSSNRFIADSIEIISSRSLLALTSSPQSTIGFISNEPIYRTPSTINDYLAPTQIVLVKFLFHVIESFSMTLVMIIQVGEHGNLVNERLAVSGLHQWELLGSLGVLSIGLLLPTYAIAFGFIVAFIDIPVNGGITFILGLTLSLIICGIIKGIFIGSLTTSPVNAVFLQCSYGFTGLFCGAIVWPQQSLPYFIEPIGYLYPYTYSSDSAVRSMIYGQSIGDYQVYSGLIYSWIHVGITLCFLLYYSRKFKLINS